MTSRQRVEAVLQGKAPDTVPIVPKISFANVIAAPDISVRQYMTDSNAMAAACLAGYRTFGWDAVSLQTDIGNEARAIGSVYEQPEDAPSLLKKTFLQSVDDPKVKEIVLNESTFVPPLTTVCNAVKQVCREIKDSVYIIAWTNGPLNVASQLLGVENLIYAMMDEDDALPALLEACTEYACTYVSALVESGADAIAFGHAMASGNMISPDFYRRFALPYETQLVSAIHGCGAKAITHICGNIHPIVEDIVKNGSDVIDFDHVCSLEYLLKHTDDVIFRGNIDPAILTFGSQEQVHDAVHQVIREAGDSNRFFLGSGCEITANTPSENLHAFVSAGREAGKAL